MITFLITIGVIWIVLRILTLVVELPFRFLEMMFTTPFTVVFWIVIILALIVAMRST